ncbi:hypothetical protein U9M48_041874 [Paspalum notatum var. saurae]|uniref:tRNA/rRNA methyltransferase SpoU type domain-containing protein n=1 Tax=Paspalum notatum var. saurae TaxID=547442 RepID=A0AAQ3XH18_PASNO
MTMTGRSRCLAIRSEPLGPFHVLDPHISETAAHGDSTTVYREYPGASGKAAAAAIRAAGAGKAAAAMAAEKEVEVESLVVVHNVAKRHNVGTLARSATAFGVAEVVVVGRRDVSAFGSHGATSHLRFRHFASLALARAYLKASKRASDSLVSLTPEPLVPPFASIRWSLPDTNDVCVLQDERGCDICGVEITDDAKPVTAHPFRRSTAFLFGNEGTGLSQKEYEICDFFVYIPQYGGGTASLNVTVAASIVLHHFGVWAGFPERGREGNKFVVAERPQGRSRGLYCTDSIEAVIEERKMRKENACDILEDNGSSHPQESNGLDLMFTD